MSKIFNLLQGVIYGGLGFYGEHLQDLVRESIENYSWMAGHLSDITMVAEAVACGQIYAGKNKLTQYLTAVVPPIMCTLHELGMVNLNSGAMIYDPQDILCYWGGAALAFGLSKFVSNQPIKKFDCNLEDKLEFKTD